MIEQQDPFAVVERPVQPKAAPVVKSESEKLLWDFFNAWEALHAVQGDKRKMEVKKKCEDAAQRMVEAAHAVKIYRASNG